VVNERRRFGRLGWNIHYEFSSADFETSATMLFNFLKLSHQDGLTDDAVPWPALKYMTGEITYGGRVTDDWDQNLLMALLEKFYDPVILQRRNYEFQPASQRSPIPYKLPSPIMKDEKVLQYIRSLPDYDVPSLFGLHQNAEAAFTQLESTNLI
jgi:dynein heavy chain